MYIACLRILRILEGDVSCKEFLSPESAHVLNFEAHIVFYTYLPLSPSGNFSNLSHEYKVF